MKVISKSKRGGKTTELIKLAGDYNGYIVCLSHDECSRIFGQSQDMGININFPITFQEFIDKKYGPGVEKFHIDNGDLLLQRISLFPVESITVTVDKDNIEEKDKSTLNNILIKWIHKIKLLK